MKFSTLFIKASLMLLAFGMQFSALWAQTPQKINYQAVVRDTAGNIMANQGVSFLMTIRDGSPGGPDIYHETHDATTNQYGIVVLKIGNGSIPSASFSAINWGSGDKYLEIQLDPNGSAGGYTWNYFGTTQLLSVPYALYSEKANTLGLAGSSGQTLRHNGTTWLSNSLLYNNGVNIGIGTTSPTALLHTNGIGIGEGNVLFTGEYKYSGSGNAPATGAGTRMMWYPDKAAFRAGYVSGTYWDTDSIGAYSIAMGYNNKAKGTNSTAWGTNTTASGSTSTTMGTNTTASGSFSAAMGYITNASGFCSISMGEYSASSGNASIASGGWTNASGYFSTAMGIYNTAPSFGETVIGSYNTAYTPSGIDSWAAGDRLFVIGNGIGTGSLERSNAMTVLKNGNTGIGTDTPAALLHTDGTGTGEGNVLLVGSYKTSNPGAAPASGAGTRMMWYPDKAAFRAGNIDGTQWNTDSIGNYSVALGYNTKAKGYYATALGGATTASGFYSTAMGELTIASGNRSTAIGAYTIASSWSAFAAGFSSKASGYASVAMGISTIASGYTSFAMGDHTTAPSYCETVIGTYNTAYSPSGTGYSVLTDRLFVVGNGSYSATSNAMTVLKNGNTGIGTDIPKATLHVKDTIRIGDNPSYPTVYGEIHHNGGSSGFVINSNAGGGSWADMYLQTNGTTKMFIESGGNVGIGTTAPAYKLEVNGSAAKPGGGSWTATSDSRLKQDVNSYTDGLNTLLKINPVRYHYNESSGFDTKPEYIGVIAQELKEIAPYMINTFTKDNTEYYNVDNSSMTYMLINAVKEQQDIIENLKIQNATQEEINKNQQKQIDELKQLINK